MTQERTGVSEGASVQATPAAAASPQNDAPPAASPQNDAPLRPSDSPTQAFTIERAREVIQQMAAEHDAAQAAEHRAAIGIELGRQQIASIQSELLAINGRDTGPLQQLHGLQVIPVNQDDHVALVYSGVASA